MNIYQRFIAGFRCIRSPFVLGFLTIKMGRKGQSTERDTGALIERFE